MLPEDIGSEARRFDKEFRVLKAFESACEYNGTFFFVRRLIVRVVGKAAR